MIDPVQYEAEYNVAMIFKFKKIVKTTIIVTTTAILTRSAIYAVANVISSRFVKPVEEPEKKSVNRDKNQERSWPTMKDVIDAVEANPAPATTTAADIKPTPKKFSDRAKPKLEN